MISLSFILLLGMKILSTYLAVMTVLASAVAVQQEAKIWKPKSLPSLSVYGGVKVFLFNVLWMTLCFLGSVLITIKWVVMFGYSDIAVEANRWVENYVARVCLWVLVGNVEVFGQEHLPPEDQIPAPVYICNHASQIDAAAVYFFGRRFKWIAKYSVLFLPGVGQIMALAGHVLIDRTKGKNTKSVSNLFDKSDAAIQTGIPMFFFPQGTRRIAERLPFKDGAFIVAQNNKSLLVPMSIEIPRNAWNHTYPLSLLWTRQRPTVRLTIHKPIPVSGNEDRDKLKEACVDVIYSVLPPIEMESSKDKYR